MATNNAPIPMLLWCPFCSGRHIDKGEFATKPHHTHACQTCGHVWRPAIVNTVGVKFLPGFKDEDKDSQNAEVEKMQAECKHPDGIDPEDGCVHCGLYSK